MFTRRTGTVSAAALASLVIAALATDLFDASRVRGDTVALAEEAEALEAQRVRVIREAEASGRVAARVIAGTLTLAGAVDELEPMLRERPGFESAWPNDPPGTFRRRVARYVCVRVSAELEHDPGRRDTVLARLEAECAALR
ncbi:unnamed protein product [Gemmataceae bacterium]|nr:unnamed protein product [Gemmataceae bacterium]VTT99102.1 unnamed protein product [Gemmataceae bacterium]